MAITFEIQGMPTPQGSKKAWVNRATGRAQMREQTGERLSTWRQDVKASAYNFIAGITPQWRPIDRPVRVTVEFRFLRPKAHFRTGRNAHMLRDNAPDFPTSRTTGDIEKLVRATHDAITSSGLWADDSLVAQLTASKSYVTDPSRVGATFTVCPAAQPAAPAVAAPASPALATGPSTAGAAAATPTTDGGLF